MHNHFAVTPNGRLFGGHTERPASMLLAEAVLFANENQNARCQRQDSHYDGRDGNVEQQSDSGEN
jgi:hypothetical protein